MFKSKNNKAAILKTLSIYYSFRILYANVGKGEDIYTTFHGFCYFIFFVYKITSYV